MNIRKPVTIIEDLKYLLLHKMLVENKTKVEAIREAIKKLGVSALMVNIALKKVDGCIAKKYGNRLYYMVCMNQAQWTVNKVTCQELFDEGFKVQKDVNGDADHNVFVKNCVTAKLFKNESNSAFFVIMLKVYFA